MEHVLKNINNYLVFTEESANILVEQAKQRGNLAEHNIKQKSKHGQEYFLVKIVEELDTEAAIMAQFKEDK